MNNCSNDIIYKYEYNNSCYISCPNGTHNSLINHYLCEDDLKCEKYYNYNHTECLEEIPEGYYMNNSELKTIDKCNIKCKNCSFESSMNNLCISCNINENYYPLFNDTINSIEFINCYNEIPDGYFFDNIEKIYKPCYSTCKNCTENGDENNNNCLSCKDNYSFKDDFENDKNCYKKCDYYYYFDSNRNYFCTIEQKCPNEFPKLIIDKRQCIFNCNSDKKYKFEYNNICYESYPEDYYISESYTTNYIHKEEYTKSLTYEIENSEYIEECNTNDLFKGKCIINNPETKDYLMLQIKNQIIKGQLNSLLLNVTKGEKQDLIAKYGDIVYQITSTENQISNEYYNISTIILDECENILKEHYNISKEEPLLIFKIDSYEEGILIPIVEYEVYNSDTKEVLNLNLCKNEKIKILLPAIIDEENYFKYNTSSDFYNDICNSYTTEYGTDITLKDRKNEFINKNMSLCESKCDYEGYISEKKKAKCECEIKTKISLISEILSNKDKLWSNFIDIKNIINIKVMKCFRTLFTLEGLKKNIGNYILLSIIFINLCLFFVFLIKGNKIILKYIGKIIPINKKINKNDINKLKNNLTKFKRNNKKIKKKKKNKIKNIQFNGNIINIINGFSGNKNVNQKKNLINSPPKKTSIYKGKLKSKINTKNKIKDNKKQTLSSRLKLNNSKLSKKSNIIIHKLSKISQKNTNIYTNNEIKTFNDYELNSLNYEIAKKYDKRKYLQYYISILGRKQLLLFTFYVNNDYNLKIIKISLLLFSFSSYYAVNALFFNDSTMHKIYEGQGGFNINHQISQIFYSSLICTFLNIIIRYLSLSENSIISLRNNENKKEKVLKCLKIKLFFFFLLLFLLLILFWYYLSSFCAVYKNTQTLLIIDTLISFAFSMLYPFIYCIFPGIFRIPALRNNGNECLYAFSLILQYL